jgi:hypothetical protein
MEIFTLNFDETTDKRNSQNTCVIFNWGKSYLKFLANQISTLHLKAVYRVIESFISTVKVEYNLFIHDKNNYYSNIYDINVSSCFVCNSL